MQIQSQVSMHQFVTVLLKTQVIDWVGRVLFSKALILVVFRQVLQAAMEDWYILDETSTALAENSLAFIWGKVKSVCTFPAGTPTRLLTVSLHAYP
ncbi:hypothetical protein [Pseudovibrio sp. SCP19]|uniref:hypothetical protein n=1 Tax=Pseudovibrio sp. SCP19 TaxID=3141374 RepID=UPI0033380CFA